MSGTIDSHQSMNPSLPPKSFKLRRVQREFVSSCSCPDSCHIRRCSTYTLVAFILLIAPVFISVSSIGLPQAASAQVVGESRFWTDIQPKKSRVRLGESILLNVTAGAESEFKETVKLDFTISVMGFSYDFDLGTISPPYPQSRLYNVSIPEYVPVSLTAIGVLKAKSGVVLEQEEIEIYIDVPFEPLSLPGRLFTMFLELSNRLLDMSATWVPTVEGALSSGLVAVGTTVVVSSLALAGDESATAFPAQKALKKVFDLFPGSVKKWLGDYVKSKSQPRKVKGSSFITKREFAAMFASLLVVTFAFAYVRSKNTVQILLMIPYVLGTSIVIELAKDLTAKTVARAHDMSAECRLHSLGLAVFAFSALLFKTPISSPKKMYYQSEKSTTRSRGLVSTAAVLVPLIIFAGFYLLFSRGYEFLGNMGMTICLISALNDSLPIQPMNGRNIYNWKKALWACLFAGSFLFYVLQFLIF